MSDRIALSTVCLISSLVGQTSRRYTGSPSEPSPSGSSLRSTSIRPASAYATQRRRGQVVVANVLVDPALEVPVARKDRADHEVVVVDYFDDLLRQRPRVADACRAPVAHQVEA